MAQTTIHVIDATATLFRAYFGMNKVRSPHGIEVGGVFGFAQALARFVKTVRPSHVALVFDAPEATFRHVMYDAYKANRADPPDDMEPQFELSARAADALGFAGFKVPGFEADDLMATMATRAVAAGVDIVLVTPDKDVLQLVAPSVLVMEPKTYELIDEAAVHARYGFTPPRLVDYLAIAGDASDNVPGVKGIGPKGAAALVSKLGGLDEIYAKLERVPELEVRGAKSMVDKLEKGRASAFLSRDLVQLRADVPLAAKTMTLGTMRYRGPREAAADELFDELGFHQPLRSLRGH